MPDNKTILITTALDVERDQVVFHLSNVEEIFHEKGTLYEVGVFTENNVKVEVAVAQVGVGNVDAAAETERAIRYFSPDYLFFVGIAGGLKQDDVSLGDVVIASKVYGYEFGKETEEGFGPRTEFGAPNYRLEQLAKSVVNKDVWCKRENEYTTDVPNAISAPIAAGEKVVKSRKSKIYQCLRHRHSDAVAVDMEEYGFYQAAKMNDDIKAIAVRGISDMVKNKNETDSEGYQKIASSNASDFAFRLIYRLIDQNDEGSKNVRGIEGYNKVTTLCSKIDPDLLEVIRSSRGSPASMLNGYRWQVRGALAEYAETTKDDLLSQLESPTNLIRILQSVPAPSMRIQVNQDRDKVTFDVGGDTLTVEDALLLWDCSCSESPLLGEYELEQAPHPSESCPIHTHDNQALIDEIDEHFENGLVEICYGETSVLWRQERQFWPPSIDAFNMVSDLESYGLLDDSFNSLLDLGSGTGFLGKLIASRNGNVDRVAFADWLLTPVVFSAINWAKTEEMRKQSILELYLDLKTEQSKEISHNNFDVLVCNPPYLPLPDDLSKQAREVALESTVAGTDLLESVIVNADGIADQLYIAFSDLARPEAKRAQRNAGLRLQQIGNSHRVPFRVGPAFKYPRYLQWLVENRPLEYRSTNRHRLWHTVRTYRLEF